MGLGLRSESGSAFCWVLGAVAAQRNEGGVGVSEGRTGRRGLQIVDGGLPIWRDMVRRVGTYLPTLPYLTYLNRGRAIECGREGRKESSTGYFGSESANSSSQGLNSSGNHRNSDRDCNLPSTIRANTSPRSRQRSFKQAWGACWTRPRSFLPCPRWKTDRGQGAVTGYRDFQILSTAPSMWRAPIAKAGGARWGFLRHIMCRSSDAGA